MGRALMQERAILERLDPELDAGFFADADGCMRLTHALVSPIRGPDQVSRVLIVGFSSAPPEVTLTVWTVECYAATMALVLESPSALRKLVDSARSDGLTGCLNYQSTLEELSREVSRADRSGLSLSCCFIDLDGFKRVNDSYGHLYGNHVLTVVAQILRDTLRSGDSLGRYGGDEFVAILPLTTQRGARVLAERICAQISAAPDLTKGGPLTASVGVAQWAAGSSVEELLAHADSAMMGAKSAPVGANGRGFDVSAELPSR